MCGRSAKPVVWHGKNWTLDILFGGTIDLYYFVSLLMTLTMAEGQKVSGNQNLLDSTHVWTDQDKIWCV